MSAGTIGKLTAIAVALCAGFLTGRSAAPDKSEPNPREGRSRTSYLETSQSPGESGKPAPKQSILSETLAFERYLARCNLARFPEMLADAHRLTRPVERSSRISRAWIARDLEGFIAWIGTQPSRVPIGTSGVTHLRIREEVVWEIAKTDPEAAWQLADHLRVNEHDKWTILLNTIKKDPAAAVLLAKAHPEIYRSNALHLSSHHAQIHPTQSLPIIEALPPGGGRTTLAHFASNYYAANPDKLDEAADWFQKLPLDTQRFIVMKLERDKFSIPQFAEALPALREVWKLPD